LERRHELDFCYCGEKEVVDAVEAVGRSNTEIDALPQPIDACMAGRGSNPRLKQKNLGVAHVGYKADEAGRLDEDEDGQDEE
jgi:hypothetical protein